MIEWVPPATAGSEARLVLRPSRALTARQFLVLFAALAGSAGAVALHSYAQGNVFAPAFALPG